MTLANLLSPKVVSISVLRERQEHPQQEVSRPDPNVTLWIIKEPNSLDISTGHIKDIGRYVSFSGTLDDVHREVENYRNLRSWYNTTTMHSQFYDFPEEQACALGFDMAYLNLGAHYALKTLVPGKDALEQIDDIWRSQYARKKASGAAATSA